MLELPSGSGCDQPRCCCRLLAPDLRSALAYPGQPGPGAELQPNHHFNVTFLSFCQHLFSQNEKGPFRAANDANLRLLVTQQDFMSVA